MAGMKGKPVSERPIWLWPLMGLLAPIGIGGVFLSVQWFQWSVADKQKNTIEQQLKAQIRHQPVAEYEGLKRPSSTVQPPPSTIAAPPASKKWDSAAMQQAPSKTVPREARDTSALSDSEMSLYASEINSLNQMAEVRRQSATEMRQAGGLQEAIALLKQASQMYEVVSCLINQRKLGVFFYQGKATCKAAIPTS